MDYNSKPLGEPMFSYPVKITVYLYLTVILNLVFTQSVYAQAAWPEPNWDRAIAVKAAASVVPDKVLKTLYQTTRVGDSRQLLDALIAIEHNGNWPVPAREYVIWSFTLGLADLDTDSASPEVLDYLSAYEPQTLVAHDDRASVGVPLFNIPAAAMGVRNAWARRHGADRAEKLLQQIPAVWIKAYLEAGPLVRRGFTDALDYASDEQLRALAHSALERLSDHPGLTTVAGKSALILSDSLLLQKVLVLGGGPDLHRLMKAASRSLDGEEKTFLLLQTIRQGPDQKAGLAIAQLAPTLLDQPAVREKMFQLLQSQSLGLSAALVLGSSTNLDIRNRLKTLANGKQSLASQRASLAIDAGQHGK